MFFVDDVFDWFCLFSGFVVVLIVCCSVVLVGWIEVFCYCVVLFWVGLVCFEKCFILVVRDFRYLWGVLL